MAQSFDTLLRNGKIVNQDGIHQADLALRDGKIAAIGALASASAAITIDCRGLHILPGVIDSQVHFREPGLEHKEDLESGSRAAVLGGVTTVFEMPNTKPATLGAAELEDKLRRAHHRMHCDFAFYLGADASNAAQLASLELAKGCCGVKVFMGSSTGPLLVDSDEGLQRVLASGRRRVAIHAEDEARLIARKSEALQGEATTHPIWRDAESARLATERALRIARAAGRRVHILHVTTADEIPLLAANRDIATAEVTPQHLSLAAPACYEKLGTFAQMNPPIRSEEHREALWKAVREGLFDVIGSDHAPHTREEKAKTYPSSPSGMPGVQTLLPLMLDHVHHGRLSLERLVDLCCHGPQRVFGIVNKGRIAIGYDADLSVVDLKARRKVESDWLASRVGWSPFEGLELRGWPIGTFLRAHKVMWDGQLLSPGLGEAVRFQDCL